jgi:hypothetical protein
MPEQMVNGLQRRHVPPISAIRDARQAQPPQGRANGLFVILLRGW